MFSLSSFDVLANGLKSRIAVRGGQVQEYCSKSYGLLKQSIQVNNKKSQNTSFLD